MKFVQAGISYSFEVTYDSPSLDVGMMVIDDSGLTPEEIGVVPMVNVYGNTYRAKFTPEAGKSYVVNKAVYTDNTYDTIDDTYSQGSDSFTAGDIAGVVLDAAIADHEEVGSVGEAITNAAQSASGHTDISGVVISS